MINHASVRFTSPFRRKGITPFPQTPLKIACTPPKAHDEVLVRAPWFQVITAGTNGEREGEREEWEDVALKAQISHINIYSETPLSLRNRTMQEDIVGNFQVTLPYKTELLQSISGINTDQKNKGYFLQENLCHLALYFLEKLNSWYFKLLLLHFKYNPLHGANNSSVKRQIWTFWFIKSYKLSWILMEEG